MLEDLHRLAVMTAITSTQDVQATGAQRPDRQKVAKCIGWPNVGQANVGAEAPIKRLPIDARLDHLNARIDRKRLSWGFRLNVGSVDIGAGKMF